MKYSWLHQIGIALTQLVNAVLWGWADETLSARAYRAHPRVAAALDWLAEPFESRHCRKAFFARWQRSQIPPEERRHDSS